VAGHVVNMIGQHPGGRRLTAFTTEVAARQLIAHGKGERVWLLNDLTISSAGISALVDSCRRALRCHQERACSPGRVPLS
jgi:hypothetical protein